MIFRWLRSVFAALTFGVPNFARGKDEASSKPVETVKPSKLASGGTLSGAAWENQVKEGRTIAGGPGSGSTYAAFDALPEETRKAWIEARKGKIRQGGAEEDKPFELNRGRPDRLAAAIAARVGDKYVLTPRGVQSRSQWPKKATPPKDKA